MLNREFSPRTMPSTEIDSFHTGNAINIYNFLGAHFIDDTTAVFRVWAPNAVSVAVIGDFNDWKMNVDVMHKISDNGIYEATICGVSQYDRYKYSILTQAGNIIDKADPYAFHAETGQKNASKLYDLGGYCWNDDKWCKARGEKNILSQPMNIYELHLGSWRTYADGTPFDYRKLADELCEYVKYMGYTHIELMPFTEYPFEGSWGYQVTGYFAPTSRYGTPHDLMYFVDTMHQAGIGVIMDWVPAHFPKDAHGLAMFDGGYCYEYDNPAKGEHREWGTLMFDYGRNEVVSFLVSSAVFWVENYHIDGIRMDAVASMLYLDYGRQDGSWLPNIYGGKENLEAVTLIQKINRAVLSDHKGVIMTAEESTTWPLVTCPDYAGGLGFTFKWNMGWMNDSLTYLEMDPCYRAFNHDKLTFGMYYAFSENFILPISHDEVVHGKKSLLSKCPLDYDEKFAGLRSFLGYMMSFPGKKLIFMGAELGQFIEWNYSQELDWLLLEYPSHQKLHNYVRELNHFYIENPAFWQIENSWDGYRWLNADDNTRNIIAYLRTDESGNQIAVLINFAPVEWTSYQLPMPEDVNSARLIFCSSWERFGGDVPENPRTYRTSAKPCGEFPKSIVLDVPPLSASYFKINRRVGTAGKSVGAAKKSQSRAKKKSTTTQK